MININGAPLAKQPARIRVSYNDLSSDNSGRNALGQMLKDRIATKVKLELEWRALRSSQTASILQAIAAIYFDVTFLDPRTASNRTIQCYAGDPQLGTVIQDSDGNPIYQDVQISLIER